MEPTFQSKPTPKKKTKAESKVNPDPKLSSISFQDFKKFLKEFHFVNITETQVIVGKNGSGKSSVLCGIVLFLQGMNSPTSTIPLEKLSILLNFHPSSDAGSDRDALFHHSHSSKEDKTFVIKGKLGAETYTSTFHLSGASLKVEINPQPPPKLVKMAFVGVEPVWTDWNEREVTPDLLGSVPNFRLRYKALETTLQEAVKEELRNLFPNFKNLYFHDTQLMVEMEDEKYPTEILFTGSAFRKLFSIWVLVFSLAICTEPIKIMLIEEPENHLYAAIQSLFCERLQTFCKSKVIQLLITSNSSDTIKTFEDTEIFAMWNKDFVPTGNHLSGKEALKTAVQFQLMNIAEKRYFLFVEGTQDVQFLKKVAQLLKDDRIHQLQIIPCGGGSGTDHVLHSLPQFIVALRSFGNDVAIAALIDKDFSKEFQKGGSGIPNSLKFVWKLPTIESYLLLDRLLSGKEKTSSFLLKNKKNIMSNSLIVGGPKTKTKISFHLLTRGLRLLKTSAFLIAQLNKQ